MRDDEQFLTSSNKLISTNTAHPFRNAEALHRVDAPAAECDGNHDEHGGHIHGHGGHDDHGHGDDDDSFAAQLKDLVVPTMTVWVAEDSDAGGSGKGGGETAFKLWTSKKKIGYDTSGLGFPTEDQPAVFADVVAKFVFAQEPTPKVAAPPIPAHIQAQLDAGHGHTHGHGGGGHHGHSHGH